MVYKLEDLLEALEKAPDNKLTIGKLKERGIHHDLIEEADIRGLIKNPQIPRDERRPLSDGITMVLDIRGFELLNQIQINKAIVKFNESSDESSNVLIGLTVFIALLTIILISPEDSTNKKNFFLVFAYIVLIFVLYHKKLLRIFKK